MHIAHLSNPIALQSEGAGIEGGMLCEGIDQFIEINEFLKSFMNRSALAFASSFLYQFSE